MCSVSGTLDRRQKALERCSLMRVISPIFSTDALGQRPGHEVSPVPATASRAPLIFELRHRVVTQRQPMAAETPASRSQRATRTSSPLRLQPDSSKTVDLERWNFVI